MRDSPRRGKTSETGASAAHLSQGMPEAGPDAVIIFDERGRITFINNAACRLYALDPNGWMGRDIKEIIATAWPGEQAREAISTAKETGHWSGVANHVSGDGSPLLVNVSLDRLCDNGHANGYLAVVRDVTDHVRMGWEREETLVLAEALVEIEKIIHSSLESHVILSSVLESAANALPADAVNILLWEENTESWRIAFSHGGAAGSPDALFQPSEFPFATRARESGKIVAVTDVASHPQASDGYVSDGTTSLLAVPLIVRGAGVGTMVFRRFTSQPFGKAALGFARELGVAVSLALENARLYDRERQSALLNATLARIDHQLHAASGRDTILSHALALGAQALGAEAAMVGVRTADGVQVCSAWGQLEDTEGSFIPSTRDVHGSLSARTGSTIAIDDTHSEELFPDHDSDYAGFRAAVVAPLMERNTVFATLYFYFQSIPHHFTRPERDFVSTLASSLSLALDNQRLFDEQAERVALSTALNDIDAIVGQSLDLSEALLDVLRVACRAVDAEGALVAVFRDKTWEATKAVGFLEREAGNVRLLPSATEAARSMGREAVAAEAGQLPSESHEQLFRELGLASALVVPLVRGDEPIGTLLLGRTTANRPWGPLKLEFATALGAHVSIAARTAQLFEAERRRSELGQSLNEIDAIIHSALRFEDVMTLAIAKGATAIGADSGSLALKEPGGWAVRYEHGLGPEFLEYTYDDSEVEFVQKMKVDRQPRVFEHGDDRPETIEMGKLVYRFASVLVSPLVVRGQIFGLMYFNRHEHADRFGPEHIDFARKLSASVSLALENLRLYEEERRSVRFAEALNTVNELLLSTLSVDEMLERIVAQASQAAGADMSVLLRLQGDDWVVTSTHNIPERHRGESLTLNPSDATNEAVRSGEPVLVPDAFNDARSDAELARVFGWHSLMAMPLRLGAEPLGVVIFGYAQQSRFATREVEFAKRLSTAITLALENARLYQAERQIAETLQETLLVMPHHIKGIDFARLYRSATVSARVGGDFIDAFQLSPRRVAIALGDVSGKGLPAASLTAMVRNTLRAHAVDGLPPCLVAEKTNNVLQLFTAADTFVTAFFGTLDSHTGRLVYVSAGHPPALIVSAAGAVRMLTTQSPVLGAFEDVPYREGLAVLEPRDTLLAYSDGVIEARGPEGLFGEERLIDLMSHLGGADPSEVVQAIFMAVDSFAEGKLRDDIALMAICREQLIDDATGDQETLDF